MAPDDNLSGHDAAERRLWDAETQAYPYDAPSLLLCGACGYCFNDFEAVLIGNAILCPDCHSNDVEELED